MKYIAKGLSKPLVNVIGTTFTDLLNERELAGNLTNSQL